MDVLCLVHWLIWSSWMRQADTDMISVGWEVLGKGSASCTEVIPASAGPNCPIGNLIFCFFVVLFCIMPTFRSYRERIRDVTRVTRYSKFVGECLNDAWWPFKFSTWLHGNRQDELRSVTIDHSMGITWALVAIAPKTGWAWLIHDCIAF